MKEFMFIFIGADYQQFDLSPEETQVQMGKWFAWIDDLKKQGKYVDGKPLTNASKTISGKDRVVADGPFAEAKELVGGYFIINADSLDDALKMAEDYPDFDFGGSVEVREVMVL